MSFVLLPDVPHLRAADKLRFDAVKPQSYRKSENFLVECGSLNMITQNQLDYAEKHGFSKIHMTVEQKLQKDYYSTQAGLEFAQNAERMKRQMSHH